MARASFISGAGEFEIDDRTYRIPERFSPREMSSFRYLLAPVPDVRGGTRLTPEQRSATETFLLRRATTCVIPGLSMSAADSLSPAQLQSIRRWIARHHPTLSLDG